MHRNTDQVALRVGGQIQDRVGGDGRGFGAALAPVEAGEREAQDGEENNEYDGRAFIDIAGCCRGSEYKARRRPSTCRAHDDERRCNGRVSCKAPGVHGQDS